MLWPVHCVQGPPARSLLPALDRERIARVFPKGTDPASTATAACSTTAIASPPAWANGSRRKGVSDVFVCGLATDYCVKFTALDAVQWVSRRT